MTPGDINWEYDPDATPGANVRAMLRAAHHADAGYTSADCKEFAARHIPGAGERMVAVNLAQMDLDMAAYSAAEFM